MEGDYQPYEKAAVVATISIHSLRMEGDFVTNPFSLTENVFQSTPSAWRETLHLICVCLPQTFQSTPSAWRETVSIFNFNNSGRHFNPLPPHGGRLLIFSVGIQTDHFNPLPPHGGRRECSDNWDADQMISIHSLRMEGDLHC